VSKYEDVKAVLVVPLPNPVTGAMIGPTFTIEELIEEADCGRSTAYRAIMWLRAHGFNIKVYNSRYYYAPGVPKL